MSGIYQVYTMIINFLGFPDESRRLRVGQLLCAVAATDSESLSAGPGPGPGPQSRSQSALSDGNSSWARP